MVNFVGFSNLGLPNGVKGQIYTVQTNTPIYIKAATIAGQIQNLKGDIILLQSELQRTKLAETNKISRSDAKLFADVSSKMLLTQDYAAKSETDSVRVILTGLQNDTTINATEKQNFVSYMSTIADILDNNQTITTASSTDVNTIQNVAASNTKAGGHANVALKERKLMHHNYFIAEIPLANNMRLANNTYEDENKILLSNNGAFKIYPNPNTGNFKILFEENNQSEETIFVTISNLLGQVVYTKTYNSDTHTEIDINTENIVKGVYIITLSQSNKNIGQSKLVIE
ncbi:MAG: T9SS type A sorting domain-containing protein [Bacteroidia bacterium]